MYSVFTPEALNPALVYLFKADEVEIGVKKLPENVARFVVAQGFKGAAGHCIQVPNEAGHLAFVVGGLGDGSNPLVVATISAGLAPGDYVIQRKPDDWPFSWVAAGWGDGAYRFDRYLGKEVILPKLLTPKDEDISDIDREAGAVHLLRDMVNTPPDDMGPDAIEKIIRDMAKTLSLIHI